MGKRNDKKKQVTHNDAVFAAQMEILKNPPPSLKTFSSSMIETENAIQSPFCDPSTGEVMDSPHIIVDQINPTTSASIVGLSYNSSTTKSRHELTLPNIALSNSLDEWPHVVSSLASHIQLYMKENALEESVSVSTEEDMVKSIQILFDILDHMYQTSSTTTTTTDTFDHVTIPFKIPKDFEDAINASDYIHRPEVIVNEGSGHSYGHKSLDKWLKCNRRGPSTNTDLLGTIRRVPNRQLSIAMSICREAGTAIDTLKSTTIITTTTTTRSPIRILHDAIKTLEKCIRAVSVYSLPSKSRSEPSIFFVSFYLAYVMAQHYVQPSVIADILILLCGRVPGPFPVSLPSRVTSSLLLSALVDSMEAMHSRCCTDEKEDLQLFGIQVSTKYSVILCTFASVLYLSHTTTDEDDSVPQIEENGDKVLLFCEEVDRIVNMQQSHQGIEDALSAISDIMKLTSAMAGAFLEISSCNIRLYRRTAKIIWRASLTMDSLSKWISNKEKQVHQDHKRSVYSHDVIQTMYKTNRYHFECIFEDLISIAKKYVKRCSSSTPYPSPSTITCILSFTERINPYSTLSCLEKVWSLVSTVELISQFIAKRVRTPVENIHSYVCSKWVVTPCSF